MSNVFLVLCFVNDQLHALHLCPCSRYLAIKLPPQVQRGTVPHYTHFIKGLNLFPRDGSPLPHPAPPKLLVEKDGDPSASALFGGSSMVGDDDDTYGCSPSDLDDSDWEGKSVAEVFTPYHGA